MEWATNGDAVMHAPTVRRWPVVELLGYTMAYWRRRILAEFL